MQNISGQIYNETDGDTLWGCPADGTYWMTRKQVKCIRTSCDHFMPYPNGEYWIHRSVTNYLDNNCEGLDIRYQMAAVLPVTGGCGFAEYQLGDWQTVELDIYDATAELIKLT
jgi:hypothetical protein